jgi:hypothetical protein
MVQYTAGYECPKKGILYFAKQGRGVDSIHGPLFYMGREQTLEAIVSIDGQQTTSSLVGGMNNYIYI